MQALQAQGHRVLMVGDGINDAAAMALAHVSIAPGTAADVSQLASDMVLRGNSLSPSSRRSMSRARRAGWCLQNFAMAAVYNLTAIPLAALGLVTPLIAAATMAGSSLLVTLNALRLARRRAMIGIALIIASALASAWARWGCCYGRSAAANMTISMAMPSAFCWTIRNSSRLSAREAPRLEPMSGNRRN